MEFRIAQITDDPSGVLPGAFVFSPPPHLPDVPRVLVERFGGENTKLGPHGWAVDSKGLRPRVIEKRGPELWLCFGAEVSFHVLPNTPVRVSIPGAELEGTEIWPPIPRGKAPPADIPVDAAPWPEPGFEIGEEAEPFGPLVVLSWVDVLADAVKRNVFDQGGAGMVDQKQNEALGTVLALL